MTTDGKTVWEYQLPLNRQGPLPQGSTAVSSAIFRVYRYTADYPGLVGKDLTPGALIETAL